MSKAHFITPRVPQGAAKTVRLGTTGAKFTTPDTGKLVKLAAESMYDLCAAGDPIEAIVAAVETATSGGFAIGSVFEEGAIFAIADGLQATPGTGTLAVGDFVVSGSVSAKGTALPLGFPRVCKATAQPNGVDPATTAVAGTTIKNAMFSWRVVSLGSVGTGAVGTQVVVERVN
jgi:hypothetical protein